ncbi:hypothetical protein [Amycolatopsis arida]|nr:hypothetical protein [Amycolatopsis arida]
MKAHSLPPVRRRITLTGPRNAVPRAASGRTLEFTGGNVAVTSGC